MIDRYGYGYDANSNRKWRENLHGSASDLDEYYTYDDLNRLTGLSRGTLTGSPYSGIDDETDVRVVAWGLDHLGNWSDYQVDADADDSFTGAGDLDQDRAHNTANEIWDETYGDAISQGGGQAAWIDPVHDTAGNMTLMPRPGDEATASEGLLCVYDAWNRLVEVYEDTETDHVLDAGEDTLIATYSYDGLHRRIRKDIDGGDTYDYYYNTAWQVLEIRKDQDTDPYEQYLWDIRYIDAPIARNRDPDCDPQTYNSQVHYYCYDANFNVTALVECDGDVIERYCYDAYGQVTVLHGGAGDGDRGEESEWDVDEDGSDVANEILFCGYRLDTETGLYHVNYRMYHPTLGRWTTRDPIGYVDGLSMYEYVRGDPTSMADPMGLTGPPTYEGDGRWLVDGQLVHANPPLPGSYVPQTDEEYWGKPPQPPAPPSNSITVWLLKEGGQGDYVENNWSEVTTQRVGIFAKPEGKGYCWHPKFYWGRIRVQVRRRFAGADKMVAEETQFTAKHTASYEDLLLFRDTLDGLDMAANLLELWVGPGTLLDIGVDKVIDVADTAALFYDKALPESEKFEIDRKVLRTKTIYIGDTGTKTTEEQVPVSWEGTDIPAEEYKPKEGLPLPSSKENIERWCEWHNENERATVFYLNTIPKPAAPPAPLPPPPELISGWLKQDGNVTGVVLYTGEVIVLP